MAKFTITFEREVVQVDQFTRVVEADNEEEAVAKAQAACSVYDHDCPDDAAPTGGDDCQSWTVHSSEPADDDAEIDELPEEEED